MAKDMLKYKKILAQTSWDCKYHDMRIPKNRRDKN
jgi:hypothetical protein